MGQEAEFGSYAWMLTHAVALDMNNPSTIHTKQSASIATDVFLMILCKAFTVQKSANMQQDSGVDTQDARQHKITKIRFSRK